MSAGPDASSALLRPTADYASWLTNATSAYDLYDGNGSYTYIYDDSYYTTFFNESSPTNSSLPAEATFMLPMWRKIAWSILFAAMVMVATGGNLIVIWIVLANKRMRTVTNYFIVNLSIADAMVSTLNVTFNYVYMVNFHWPFGTTYCKISSFVATLSISASVFTMMAISIDRYMAIMKPLRPRMGKRTTLAIAATVWLVAVVLSGPNMLFFTTYRHVMADGNYRIVCYMEWPDGATNESWMENVYNMMFMVLTYFLPIGSMVYTYTRVGIELWGSQSIGECTQRQLDNIQSKRRVVKMMMMVVTIFAICWLPFHTYFILTFYYPDINKWAPIQEVYLLIYWLAMSNSMYNPFIYCWMNHRFRRGFQRFFRFCPFVRLTPETLQRREVLTSRYSCSGSPDHNRIVRNDTERSFLNTCPGSPNHHHHHHHHQPQHHHHHLLNRHHHHHQHSHHQHQRQHQLRMSQCGSVRIPLHLTTAHNSAINHQSFNAPPAATNLVTQTVHATNMIAAAGKQHPYHQQQQQQPSPHITTSADSGDNGGIAGAPSTNGAGIVQSQPDQQQQQQQQSRHNNNNAEPPPLQHQQQQPQQHKKWPSTGSSTASSCGTASNQFSVS